MTIGKLYPHQCEPIPIPAAPGQHDHHVVMYDARFVYEALKQAQQSDDRVKIMTIKTLINVYYTPFRKIRQSLQSHMRHS